MANPPSFENAAAYSAGKYVPINEAKISVFDWGFTRSDAVYDVVHVVDKKFFRLADHIDRFERSMVARRLNIDMSREEIETVLHNVVSLSGLSDAYVGMVALRGQSRVPGSRNPKDCDNHLLAYAVPWIDVISKDMQEKGARLWISDHPRVPDASVDPTVKNYQWSDLTSGLFDATDRGYDTVVLCDADGIVTEGPGFNLFVVKDGRVTTPDRGVLQGITRATVIELCAELGISCQIVAMDYEQLHTADEVFVTSTAGGIMPIGEVSGNPNINTSGGPLFRKIHDAYWRAHQSGRYTTPVHPHNIATLFPAQPA